MTESLEAKKIEIPENERISPVRSEDVRKKAPGNLTCAKCSSERMHISHGGTRSLRIWMRPFFVVYRCHTCGTIYRHTRLMHWVRKIFGKAREASRKVIVREETIDSQAADFKQAKPDRNPVFREKVKSTALNLEIEPSFDIDPIVRSIKSNYTAKERQLLASKFNEISVLIDPPAGTLVSRSESDNGDIQSDDQGN